MTTKFTQHGRAALGRIKYIIRICFDFIAEAVKKEMGERLNHCFGAVWIKGRKV